MAAKEKMKRRGMTRKEMNQATNQMSFRDKINFTVSWDTLVKYEGELYTKTQPVLVDGVMVYPNATREEIAGLKILIDSQWKKIDKLVSNAPAITAKDWLDWQNQHMLEGDEIAPAMNAIEMRTHIRHMLEQQSVDSPASDVDNGDQTAEELPSFLT